MSKEFNIATIQDIADATNEENIDNFLKDLKGSLMMYYPIKRLAESINQTGVEFPSLVWIDDNKHDISINLVEKK